MIYVFKTPFKTSKGKIIPSGDKVFIDDPDAQDEIAQEVKRRIEEGDKVGDKPKRKRKTKIEDGNI